MKKPVIYPRLGYFWIRYYVKRHPVPIRTSTGIKLDIAADLYSADNPTWFKSSKHRIKLQRAIREAEEIREGALMRDYKPRKRTPSFEALMDQLNTQANAERKLSKGLLSPQTIRRRQHSLNRLIEYDAEATFETVDLQWISEFQKWLDRFKPWTQVTIMSDLKMLFRYAEQLEVIAKSPFEKIQIGQPESVVEHTDLQDEFKLFTQLYRKHRKAFYFLITERLAGFRSSDLLRMEDAFDIPNRLITTTNVKKRRVEQHPMSEPLAIALRGMPEGGFGYKSYFAIRKTLGVACVEIGLPVIGTHQLKRNYGRELEDVELLPHIYNLLMHHIVKGMTKTGATHYTGRNIALMKRTLDSAQMEWMPFLENLTRTT